jgi:tetratricopeptide (TPR) repeat protein
MIGELIMDLDEILREITSGLSGDSKQDISYLQEQMEIYKDHEFSKEITGACGRIIYDLIPEDKQKELERIINNDVEGIKATLKEIRFNVFEGDIEKAFRLSESLVSKIEEMAMFENDLASEYFTFNNVFEEMLYVYYNKPKRDLRHSTIPYGEIYYIHGNLLFEMKRIDEARIYLEKSLRWNPASCTAAFEYIETFKVRKEFDDFFRLTKEQFKYAYKPEYLARCYRNLGFYFIEKEEYSVAAGCYLMSMMYESDNKQAQSELYYIQQTAPKGYKKPTPELLDSYGEKYGFSIGACSDIIGLARVYSQKALKEGNLNVAIYFLDIFCGLTQNEDAIKLLEKLKIQLEEKGEV